MEDVSRKASQHNAEIWDKLVAMKSGFTATVSARALNNPLPYINIYQWLPKGVHGRRVLCLGAGGGKHAPLYAAAGADVTVVDISEAMLEKDRIMAERYDFRIRRLQRCMTDLHGLMEKEFDLIMQPVSSCYIQNIEGLHREVARVLKPGGLYIVQHKQPFSLQTTPKPECGKYAVEVSARYQGKLPPIDGSEHRESGAMEFLHTLEALVGGLCRHGFVIEDLREPWHGKADALPGSFAHRCEYVPPYLAMKARRRIDSGIAISPIIADSG